MTSRAVCNHCRGDGEDRLWEAPLFRIVLVHDAGFPGWCRVIWNSHVAELSDLQPTERQQLLDAVVAVEIVLREELSPRKINIASLGTAAPHLHVHIVPRFEDDPTFPEPVWNPPVRSNSRKLTNQFRERVRSALAKRLAGNMQ